MELPPLVHSIRALPLEIQVEILQKRAFSTFFDLSSKRVESTGFVRELLELVRRSDAMIAGGALHEGWMGGTADCKGWARSPSQDIDIWVDVSVDTTLISLKEAYRRYPLESTVEEAEFYLWSSFNNALVDLMNKWHEGEGPFVHLTDDFLATGPPTHADPCVLVDDSDSGYGPVLDFGMPSPAFKANLGIVRSACWVLKKRSIQVHYVNFADILAQNSANPWFPSAIHKATPGAARLCEWARLAGFDLVPLGFLTYSKLNAPDSIRFNTSGIMSTDAGLRVLYSRVLWPRLHGLRSRPEIASLYAERVEWRVKCLPIDNVQSRFPDTDEPAAEHKRAIVLMRENYHRAGNLAGAAAVDMFVRGNRVEKYSHRGYRFLYYNKGIRAHEFRSGEVLHPPQYRDGAFYTRVYEIDDMIVECMIRWLPEQVIQAMLESREGLESTAKQSKMDESGVVEGPMTRAERLFGILTELDAGVYDWALQPISSAPSPALVHRSATSIHLPEPYSIMHIASHRHYNGIHHWGPSGLDSLSEDEQIIITDLLFPREMLLTHRLAVIRDATTHWDPIEHRVNWQCHCREPV